MVSWYIHKFIAATLALSPSAGIQLHVPLTAPPAYRISEVRQATVADSTNDSKEVEEEGASYDLRVLSLKSVVGSAHDAFDTLIFTITNAGSDTSYAAKLLVGLRTESFATTVANSHTNNARIAERIVIPPIPPGGRVTLQARVPKLQGDSTCYAGIIELPEEK